MITPVRDPDHTPRLTRRGFGLLALGGLAAPVLAGCGGAAPPAAPASTAPAPTPQRIAYGGHPDQFGELTVPDDRSLPRALVVVLHGGFWQSDYDLSLMRPLCAALVAEGFATWNVEYRRLPTGGGWTATFDDVGLATDHVLTFGSTRLDLDRVLAIGHSAGGHLAVWAAARAGMPAGAPGAAPRIRLAGVVSQAGVLDLAAARASGAAAVDELVGGTVSTVPERYELASPIERVPLGVPSICVHGTADDVVPIGQSETFVERAVAAGDRSELVRVEGANHTDVIDVGTPAGRQCVDALGRLADG